MEDNVERVGPDMGQIPRDTFGDVLEFRIRIKSNAHIGVGLLIDDIKERMYSSLYDIIFIKENKHLT